MRGQYFNAAFKIANQHNYATTAPLQYASLGSTGDVEQGEPRMVLADPEPLPAVKIVPAAPVNGGRQIGDE